MTEREEFECECRKLFDSTSQSFNRDNGMYYNTISRSFSGHGPLEQASVAMLWTIYQAANARTKPVMQNALDSLLVNRAGKAWDYGVTKAIETLKEALK